MGKKRIIKISKDELLKETEQREAAQRKAVSRQTKIKKKVEKGKAYIRSTYNNTVITLTDLNGNVLAWATAGHLGFKGPKKATPYAASRVAAAVVEKVKKVGLKEVEVFVKGIGGGRESAIRALAANGLEISFIKDITPIPHNGCRPPKPRRV